MLRHGAVMLAIVVLLTVPVSASNIQDEIDPVKIPVVLILKNQPAYDLSIKIKQEYREQFEEITKSAREIYSRIEPSLNETELRSKNVSELAALEQSLLSKEEKAVLKEVGKNLESKVRSMRREILTQTAPIANEAQEPIIEKIEAMGGTVKYSSKIFNAIAADIPVSYMEELSKENEVYRIYNDYVLNASLDISTYAAGANTWWSYGYTGTEWDVAIVDTGIDGTHPALTVDYAGVFHATGQSNYYYADNSTSTDDLHMHGTHVAGIVASNNSTYKGIAYGIDKLINAKAGWRGRFGGGYMYWSDAMAAIDWALFGNADDADVISLSFGGGATNGDSGFEHFFDAISYELDTPVVVAAGNGGPGISTISDPAGAFNVIAVGNMNDKNTVSRIDDSLASSSSRGPTLDGRIKPDILAPGTSIMSANNNWETQADFISATGTSMATPHITGSIILIMDYKNSQWQPEAIKALLLNTAQDLGAAGPDNEYGYGYVDLTHAYVHRDDVFTGSIDDLPDGSVEKFYKGPAELNDTATLVWNRHIDYIGSSNPTYYLPISNLDLYMFDESSGSIIDSSTSSVDNIEQVKSDANYSWVVLKIEPSGSFPESINLEDYGLATEEGFTEVTSPTFNVSIYNPGSAAAGTDFNVNVTVNNSGGVAAHDVSVSITLPDGFNIVSGVNPQSIGSINAGGSKTAALVVKAPNVSEPASYSLEASVSSDSYGESYSGSNVSTITVNENIQPASVFIDNVTIALNGTITTPILIKNITDVGSSDIILSYNPGVVQVISMENSSFDVFLININNSTGIARMAAFQIVNPGLSGSVKLADVTFKAKGSAGINSQLNFTIITLKDISNNPIPNLTINATCSLIGGLCGDVNDDNITDISDAMWLAKNVIGMPGYPVKETSSDVNGDGTIDIADAMWLAKNVIGMPDYPLICT